MNKNISYLAIVLVTAVVLYVLLADDNLDLDTATIDANKVEDKVAKKTEKKKIEIVYSDKTNKKDTKIKKIQKEKSIVEGEEVEAEEESEKTYSLISASREVGKFAMNVVSSSPIPSRDPSQFPQIPASISGKIDNIPFSLIIPSDLGVKDFSIKIVNQETHEEVVVVLENEHIRPGSSSVLNVDSNNFENIELRSDSSSMLPPLPPLTPN